MANIKSYRGSAVDIDKLVQQNSRSVAISGGGIRMNASGDMLSQNGVVIKTAADIDAEYNEHTIKKTQQISLGELNKYQGIVTTANSDIDEEKKKEIELEKQKAKKAAKKIEIATESLVSGGQAIIKKHDDDII